MATTTVRKIGNSLGIIIPADVVSRLNVSEGDRIFLTESPDGVKLTAYDEDIAKQIEVGERIMRENREVLRRLAQ